MGYAIAEAAKSLGHQVSLVSGPTSLKRPNGVKFLPVVTARQMQAAANREFKSCSLVVMAAAVCDFRPVKTVKGKLKKESLGSPTLRLAKNPDILRSFGRRKGSRKLIGFALEIQNGQANAFKKLREKNLDFIVLNGPGTLDQNKASVTVFGRDGSERNWKNLTKAEIGRRLIRLADEDQD